MSLSAPTSDLSEHPGMMRRQSQKFPLSELAAPLAFLPSAVDALVKASATARLPEAVTAPLALPLVATDALAAAFAAARSAPVSTSETDSLPIRRGTVDSLEFLPGAKRGAREEEASMAPKSTSLLSSTPSS